MKAEKEDFLRLCGEFHVDFGGGVEALISDSASSGGGAEGGGGKFKLDF